MYSVLVNKNKRNSLLYYLKSKKIDASVHFDPPLHKQNYLKKFYKKLPNTEELSKRILTLPIYPNLKANDMKIIFKHMKDWYTKNNK